MTRLTENDIAGIEAEWATYERRLEELTGDDLLTLAARTLGIDPETARSGVRELRVGAIPISSGEGLIGGFADSLASIAGHLGFEADVLPADVPGFQLAKSGGFDLFIWADDDTYLAENILTGIVGENGRATGRGFATALIRMAARKRLDKRALVLGAGPVGCAGAETLALAGYEGFSLRYGWGKGPRRLRGALRLYPLHTGWPVRIAVVRVPARRGADQRLFPLGSACRRSVHFGSLRALHMDSPGAGRCKRLARSPSAWHGCHASCRRIRKALTAPSQ